MVWRQATQGVGIINDEVLKECASTWRPSQPNLLTGIRALPEIFGHAAPQGAVFDTVFFTVDSDAYLYAFPYHLYRRHRILRYGSHR